MGIGSKRAIASLEKQMEHWKTLICEAAKISIQIDVQWESIVNDDNHHYAVEAFEQIFITSTVESLKRLCADEIGAEAVAQGLKRILMTNVSENHTSFRWASFENGVLTLDHWLGNAPSGQDRQSNLVEVLESGLG